MNMKLRNIPFSPPDMSDAEIEMVAEALRSGWITTGPKTKEFEQLIAMCCGTEKAVCLNSATAAMEMVLHVMGVGPGDEVIMPAYTYTASASVVDHVGATIKMVDIRPAAYAENDGNDHQDFEMDYEKLAAAITERTKVIVPVDLAGICANVEKIFEVVNRLEIKALMTFRLRWDVSWFLTTVPTHLVPLAMVRWLVRLRTSLHSLSMLLRTSLLQRVAQ